ncbi:MAG: electron transfer flavoprotein-ubiquinone oxidoreductase [Candidatus Omnitrophica bacterium]|nr:electron transfer flavoprotein-ubiquinone oxidoreductase [Candidatus Omnitrophota bacterium]
MTTKRDVVHTDVLIIGGGSAGLATSIHLADLIRDYNQKIDQGQTPGTKLSGDILLLEKGSSIGSHSLSGAVVNPKTFRKLFPEIEEKDFPFESPVTGGGVYYLTKKYSLEAPFHPPFMGNHGNFVACLGKVNRWLADIAEKKGVQIFTGFSAHELLLENGKLAGIRTGDSGVDAQGEKQPNYQPGTEVRAKLIIFAEGPRGHLTKQLIKTFSLDQESNPQVYSTGVKELWEVPEGTLAPGTVIHTMGYPLTLDQFGGGFIYAISKTQVAVGLVVGLDYEDPTFDPHNAFQVYKQQPFVKKILEKGKMLRYGAKTIPEGGYFAMPKFYLDHAMIVGDSAGFLSMPSLKGVHLGMESGMLAADSAFEALKKNDFREGQLERYQKLFESSDARKDLYRVRNFRQGFKHNLIFGMIHFGAQLFTGGWGLSLTGRLRMEEDGKRYKTLAQVKGKSFQEKFKDLLVFDKQLTFDKVTDVFYSGSQHDEHQPCHLLVPDREICRKVCIPKYGGPCQYFCPAEVYEIVTDPKTGEKDLHIHPTNCVHCKTCDIKEPLKNITWVTPYGGDGPEYENL